MALAAAAIGILAFFLLRRDDPALTASFSTITDDYRRIIVLMAGARRSTSRPRPHDRRRPHPLLTASSRPSTSSPASSKAAPAAYANSIRYLSNDSGLHDADKLAFLDLVETLDTPAAATTRSRRSATTCSPSSSPIAKR